MRLNELVNLKISDIDFYNQSIKVLGKGNKERLIPFGRELNELLKEYLKMRKKNFTKETEMLLLTDKGENIYHRLVYRIINQQLQVLKDKEFDTSTLYNPETISKIP
jgi:integrase/recombinase XerC